MKKIVLLTGMAFSLLLASCSTDVNDVDLLSSSEEYQEKPSTLITPAQAKTAVLNFFNNGKGKKIKL